MARFPVVAIPLLVACAAIGLSACDDAPGDTAATLTIAEQGCLRDVGQTTNNVDVALLGSEFSEAGTSVTVGVGAERAPWRCIGLEDGTTAGIESLTDEGLL